MKPFAVLLAILMATATPALAVDAAAVEGRYTPDGASTAGMVQCIGAELTIQDAALNAAWRALVADMTPDQKAALQKAQRAWIAFRDADCAARYSPDWGSMSTLDANFCVLRRTVERTVELETFRDEGPQ